SLLIMVLMWGTAAYAQNATTVTGTVTDAASGKPLPAVNISVVGTHTGTSSDADGNYRLVVPNPSDSLQFSFIGYSTKVVPVNGHTTIDVQLTLTQITGKQLVVIGYGTKQQNEITGAISSVSSQDLQQEPTASPVKALQGHASGVTIVSSGQPG